MATNIPQIPKLEGAGNYEMWKTKVKMILIRKRLWAFVEGNNTHPGEVPTVEDFPNNYDHVSHVYDTALRHFEK